MNTQIDDDQAAMDAWDEVDGCISEIEWFVSRKKDLAAPCHEQKPTERTWADVLATDIQDLREAIKTARASVSAGAGHE